jgi:tryptophan 2,3-dioxygenase
VDLLIASGKLSRGLGLVLRAEITAAQELINRGRIPAAKTLLRAIVVEVDLLVRLRVLSAADAAPLRAALVQAIGSL